MATGTKLETKQTAAVMAPSPSTTHQETTQAASSATTQSAKEKFKTAIEALDVERTALVKSTIENLKPGTPFDHTALRAIQKIEVRKNRLITGRFAALLKKNEPGISPIVHQIIEL